MSEVAKIENAFVLGERIETAKNVKDKLAQIRSAAQVIVAKAAELKATGLTDVADTAALVTKATGVDALAVAASLYLKG